MIPPQIKKKEQSFLEYLDGLGIPSQKIHNKDLLLQVFIHKSFSADYKESISHNERLEFLGDGVLSASINKLLFLKHPEMDESELTLYKIALVREETLAEVARNIGIQDKIFISNGEEKMQGRDKDAILADCLEGLLGFFYLELGIEIVESFVETYIYSKIQNIQKNPVKSYKTMIQEIIQKEHKLLPEYKDIVHETDEKGNPLTYKSELFLLGKKQSEGIGTNKKKAQELAAKAYFDKIEIKTKTNS